MAHSTTEATQVLLYNTMTDRARWVIKSQAHRMQAVDPFLEIIDEDADNFEVIARLAGPKPRIVVGSDENYGGDTQDAG